MASTYNRMKRITRAELARVALAAGLLATLAACNTVSGLGRDLESVGDSVSGAADGAK